jgi:ABC-type Fe3+ transport system substrate-binding protein
MEAEGVNSPADILMTVDAGRLYRADELGLFQPYVSDTLDSACHPICAIPMATGTAFRSAHASSSTPRTGSKTRR